MPPKRPRTGKRNGPRANGKVIFQPDLFKPERQSLREHLLRQSASRNAKLLEMRQDFEARLEKSKKADRMIGALNRMRSRLEPLERMIEKNEDHGVTVDPFDRKMQQDLRERTARIEGLLARLGIEVSGEGRVEEFREQLGREIDERLASLSNNPERKKTVEAILARSAKKFKKDYLSAKFHAVLEATRLRLLGKL